MKLRSTTPVSSQSATKKALVAIAAIMAISTTTGIVVQMADSASADSYDVKINRLQKKISRYNAEAKKLSKKADTLKGKLAKLNSEKAQIQSSIDVSQAKYDKYSHQIAENKQRIKDNKAALGKIIASMYVDNDVTTLELLASSDNLSDYFNKQSYQDSIRHNLTSKIDQIEQLKKDLEKKQKDVKRVMNDQKNQRSALASKENEQAELIKQTNGKESQYKKLASKANSRKVQLEKEQQAAIARAYNNAGAGTVNAGSLSSYTSWAGSCYVDAGGVSHGGANGNGGDPSGYGCNQCVSYTAWKMGKLTGHIPSYWGNANQWPGSARAAGYKVTSQPRARAFGVISAGAYGHIVYVEAYHASSNTVDISQYNEWLPGLGFGHYSTRYGVNANAYDTYIYI